MKIIDIIESVPPLQPATSPEAPISTAPNSATGVYGAMVRQAVTAQRSPENPYEGLGQDLDKVGAPEAAYDLGAPTTARNLSGQEPAALPPAAAEPAVAFEAADWTMTFGDFLTLYEAERAG